MTRKGSRQRAWSREDERALAEMAGREPKREICRRLKRSGKAVERKAARMGLSLRCERAEGEACPSCGLLRRYFDERTGFCEVCHLQAMVDAEAARQAEALREMPPALRAKYEKADRTLLSKPPEGLSERDEVDWLKRKWNAARQRTRRMRAQL